LISGFIWPRSRRGGARLLKQIGVAYDVLALRAVAGRMDVVRFPATARPRSISCSAWRPKATCGWRQWIAPPAALPVLRRDTVKTGGRHLGKPGDSAEAATMLTRLSGREHRCHTAVAVQHEAGRNCACRPAWSALPLDTVTIALPGNRRYLGKAGAYAIRGAPAHCRAHRRQLQRHHGFAVI
jgi:septum formation protein